MNKKQAIKLLEKQKAKLIDNSYAKNSAIWITLTAALVGEIFGLASMEYKIATRIDFSVAKQQGWSNQDVMGAINRQRDHIADLLDSWIELINDKGVNNERKGNFLQNISDGWLQFIIGILISTIVGAASLGYYFGQRDSKVDEYEKCIIERDKLNKELSKSVTNLPNANPVSKIDTNNNGNPNSK